MYSVYKQGQKNREKKDRKRLRRKHTVMTEKVTRKGYLVHY
jgi:hypothetical protein